MFLFVVSVCVGYEFCCVLYRWCLGPLYFACVVHVSVALFVFIVFLYCVHVFVSVVNVVVVLCIGGHVSVACVIHV